MSYHSDWLNKARVAIDRLNSDILVSQAATRCDLRDILVSQAATRCDLRDLRDHIDTLLESLGGDGLDDYADLEDEG